MSTVAVFVPSRNLERMPSDWLLGPMPFFSFDQGGSPGRAGLATPAQLPRARRTVLILGPSDVTLLRVPVPPLRGPRLRQALPNLVEEQLAQDVARCHVALGPAVEPGAERTLAVVDRAWLRFVLETFRAAGVEHLKVVAAIACLPAVDADVPCATLWGQTEGLEPSAATHLEVVLQDGTGCAGGAFAITHLATSLASFANGRPLAVQEVTCRAPALRVPPGVDLSAVAPLRATLELASVARTAVELDFDLCQFEFAAQTWSGARGTVRRWRWPLGLAAAAGVVALAGLNLDWLVLAHEKAELDERAAALFGQAFPRISALESPALQMTGELDRLRARAGEPVRGDFLVMADGLARALGPTGVTAIVALDYSEHVLSVTFAGTVQPEADWTKRLDALGLVATESNGKWLVRPAP